MRRDALLSLLVGGVFCLARCGGLIASSSPSLRRRSLSVAAAKKQQQTAKKPKKQKTKLSAEESEAKIKVWQRQQLGGGEMSTNPALRLDSPLTIRARKKQEAAEKKDATQLRSAALEQHTKAREGDKEAYKEAMYLYGDVVRLEPDAWRGWADLSGVMIEAGSSVLEYLKVVQYTLVVCPNDEEQTAEEKETIAELYYEFGTKLSQLDEKEQQEALDDDELFLADPPDGGVDKLTHNAMDALTAAAVLGGKTIRPLARQAKAALTALALTKVPKRASREYVEAIFDDLASTYDDAGNCTVPEAVATLLKKRVLLERGSLGYETCLDAGCGTGLCGLAIKKSQLVRGGLFGVDLSSNMSQTARDRKIYDEVVKADIVDLEALAYLKTAGKSKGFELIVAGDVLPYFGELDEAFAALDSVLKPGGDLVFTSEDEEQGTWTLRQSGRYAHSAAYVRTTAASRGLVLVQTSPLVARIEDGKPLQETIYVLHKKHKQRR